MKKNLLSIILVICIGSIAWTQTSLVPGDIAVIGFNNDNPDEWAFVAMVDLAENTEIKFTDNGWLASGSFRSGEGVATWTAPAGGVLAGKIVVIKNDGGWTTTTGSVTATGSLFLSGSGDQIIVYQGDDGTPSILFAINSEGTGWQTDATSSNTSALPPGLTNGLNAIALDEIDNAVYSMVVTIGTPNELMTAFCEPLNWVGDNSILQIMPSTDFTINTGIDTTPPGWTDTYPFVENMLDTQGTLVVNLDEPGTAYYIVVFDNATPPTSEQVKAGASYDTVQVLPKGGISVTAAGTEYREVISGAQPNSNYDIWVVAEDDEGTPNIQTGPVKIDITSGSPRSLMLTEPVGGETYYMGDSVTITWTSENITSINLYSHNAPPDVGPYLFAGPLPAGLGSFKTVVPLDAGIDSVYLLIKDVADETFADSSGWFYLLDTINPKSEALYPENAAVGVPLDAYLTITFDEQVYFGNGNIIIKEGDGTVFETFDVASKTGSFLDLDYQMLKIYFGTSLEKDKFYYVEIDAGALVDFKDNPFNGYSGDSWWSFSTGSDLFISEYIEVSSGSDKAIELFNNSGTTVDLSDYALWRISNEGTWDEGEGNAVILKGELDHGDVFVICNGSATTAMQALSDSVGSSATFFNGDDAVGLARKIGEEWYRIDQIGDEYVGDITAWDVAGVTNATKDHTLIRKFNIERGNTNWTESAGTGLINSEWKVYPDFYMDNLGMPTANANEETEILSFSLTDTMLVNVTVDTTINAELFTVDVTLLFGTDVDSLVPVIVLSEGATIVPEAGDTIDFTNPVVFEVTAEDGLTSQNWTVTVTVAGAASSETDVLGFSIDDSDATIYKENFDIVLEMPFGTDLSNLTPEIEVSAGATVSPLSGIAQDFSTTVVYTVTAQDGTTTQIWSANITVEDAIPVSNVAELRAVSDNNIYQLTGEAILTMAVSYRNGKFIQDATGGIAIDDNDGLITTLYSIGDGITGLIGTIGSYNGLTQIVPVADPGAPSTTGNAITPLVVTVSDLKASFDTYESELILVESVGFQDAGGNFANGTNYTIAQGTDEMAFRAHFFDADYIGTVIPGVADVTGLAIEYNGSVQIASRFLADILNTTQVESPGLDGISIYPNPSNGSFMLKVGAEKEMTLDIEIMNLQGQVVFRNRIHRSGSFIEVIDISTVSKGLYLIRLTEGTSTRVEKIEIY